MARLLPVQLVADCGGEYGEHPGRPMTTPVKGVEAETLFAVVCKWADRRSIPDVIGHEAIVLKATDANEALLVANTARPDLWEDHGPRFYRETAVHPAAQLQDKDTTREEGCP